MLHRFPIAGSMKISSGSFAISDQSPGVLFAAMMDLDIM
jgi:hypothetical protein